MIEKMSYCHYCQKLPIDDVNQRYHQTEYGFPLESDNELFGRLVLEINQAGLSWTTILKKEPFFRSAYDNFDIATIAHYTQNDRDRLLQDAGIIRNRLKVDAAIYNAQQILSIQNKEGSFKRWLDKQECENIEQWVNVFKKQFKFVGGEIVNEFLMSTGYIKGAHVEECPIYDEVIKKNPTWKQREKINALYY